MMIGSRQLPWVKFFCGQTLRERDLRWVILLGCSRNTCEEVKVAEGNEFLGNRVLAVPTSSGAGMDFGVVLNCTGVSLETFVCPFVRSLTLSSRKRCGKRTLSSSSWGGNQLWFVIRQHFKQFGKWVPLWARSEPCNIAPTMTISTIFSIVLCSC